jgi:hypothetical protein
MTGSKTDKIETGDSWVVQQMKQRDKIIAALLAVAKKLVEAEPIEGDDRWECALCGERDWGIQPANHKPDCVITEARAAIKLAEEGD